MAEIAVAFLLHKLNSLDSFVQEKAQLLQGIHGEFEDVMRELQHMQAFLRVADSIGDSHPQGPQLKVWVEQVRDVAYDTEDVIDEFVLRLAHHHGRGFYASLHKVACFIKNLRARHRIASDIQDIKIRVSNIAEQYKRHRQEKRLEPGSSTIGDGRARLDSQGDALLIEGEDLVGIDKPKEELMSLLANGSLKRQVIPVSGMGGMGKTTLVRQVYKDPEVKKHFKISAWVIVSRSFEKEELLRDTVEQIYTVIRQSVPEDVKDMRTDELRLRIKDLLQRSRYLIVLDDVWETRDWDFIKLALPSNNYGSRVIITTRNADVANSSIKDPQGTVYNMEPLPEADYWALFCRKTFQGNSCPTELKSICGSILRRCGGLPLAIVAISGVLAAKDVGMIDEWENISENLGSEIEENGKLEDMTKVLSLSFSDLPYHLKSCFLYLSIFPEDHFIERMRLIRLWIAEGFVIVNENNGRTPEEVAEDYLKELLSRSLVQVADTSSDGRVITCRIHDLIREIIISKAREQNFAAVAKEANARWPEKVRHLSVINNLPDTQQKRAFPKLRSFLTFYIETPITDLGEYGFRLLNVLDLQGTPLEVFPGEIVKLYHLKYLSLKDTKIKEIPRSIKKLQNLETLDLKHTFVSELPVEIQRLKKLRHLLVYRYEYEAYARFHSKFGFKALAEIGCLQSLQKLSFIEANKGSNHILKELGKLSQLRRLGIVKFRTENGEALCSSLEKLSKLRALSISSVEKNEIIDLNHLACPPKHLRRIYLIGRIEELPKWISSLQNLAKLFLKWSRLKDDPLTSIQHLPNLVHLEFQQVYHGEKLCFKSGGFRKLKFLGLDKLDELRSVSVEKGSMPCLERLILQRCRLLHKAPSGIERLSRLKVLEFFDMPAEFIMGLYQDGGEDYWRVEHIPEVYSSYLRKNGAWEAYPIERFREIDTFRDQQISSHPGTSTMWNREPMRKI